MHTITVPLLLLFCLVLGALVSSPSSSSFVPVVAAQEQAFTTGRIYWHGDSKLRKDFPVGACDWSGTSFGLFVPSSVHNGFYPLQSVGIDMSVLSSSDANHSKPHVFSVFLWHLPVDAVPEEILPARPFDTAHRHFNFSTAAWTSGALTNVPLFNVSNDNSSVLVWVIKETEADFNVRYATRRNYATFVSFVVDVNLTEAGASASSTPSRRVVLTDHQQDLMMLEMAKGMQQRTAEQNDADKSSSSFQHLPLSQLSSPFRRAQQPNGETHRQYRQERPRLLFIGDSLTAGFCNIGQVEQNTSTNYTQQRFTATWTFQTANDHLRAAMHTVAWSGMGLVANYDNISTLTMSDDVLYRTVGTNNESEWLWNYSSGGASAHTQVFVPDAIFINLGTNDFSGNRTVNESQPLVQLYHDVYVETVRKLGLALSKFRDGSPLPIFFACGPVRGERWCPVLQMVVDTVTKEHSRIIRPIFVEFASLPQNQTSCGHPNSQSGGEAAMTKQAVKVIKENLGL